MMNGDPEISERLREFEAILLRVHDMLRKAAPLIANPEARQIVVGAINEISVLYYFHDVPEDGSVEERLDAAVAEAIKIADEQAEIKGEPFVVIKTPSGQIVVTGRSRFEQERPFGTGPENLVYDTGKKVHGNDQR